ncbi:MAG TPA: hypothetical protein VMB34_05885 [Acetobacteraceae bacterium]|nr:hypothetical protein [Acetobacteraceae bacterium]
MSRLALLVATLIAVAMPIVPAPAPSQIRLDSINTNFRWLGPDDRIVVERYAA